MRLHIEFNRELMLESIQRGTSPLFFIYWNLGTEYYPDDEWVDLGAIIIGWWLVALERIKDGSRHEELVFREGPFRLKLVADPKTKALTVWPGSLPFIPDIPLSELVEEVIKAAEITIAKFKEMGISELDQKNLLEGVRRVKT